MKSILCRILITALATFSVLKGVEVNAQIVNPAVMDTVDVVLPGKLIVGAYVDAYFGYNERAQSGGDQAYGVSFERNNEFAINMAYLDVKYVAQDIRARLVPGFGTYMAANYNLEPIQLRNFVEASVGFRIWRGRNVWLDAGVIGSPYTNESAISRDHLMLTRSLAAEYAPYYLTGVKLSAPLSTKFNLALYVLNGWQNIQETNKQKSVGSQLEYRPTDKLLINWNTYIGYEESILTPQQRGRYFSDIYLVYNPQGKFSATACLYGGLQQVQDTVGERVMKVNRWACANAIGRYRLNPKTSLSGRIEWFSDPGASVSSNINMPLGRGLQTWSGSLCLNYRYNDLLLLRLEGKRFWGGNDPFHDQDGNAVATNTYLVGGINIIY
jgi:hypothetical protein